MTEQAQAQPAPQEPAQQIPPMTAAQVAQVKQAFKESLKKAYMLFMNTALQIPAEIKGVQNAVLFFDTGFFWFEKGIDHLPVQQVPQSVSPQQPETPSQPQEPQAPQAPQEAKPVDLTPPA